MASGVLVALLLVFWWHCYWCFGDIAINILMEVPLAFWWHYYWVFLVVLLLMF
jgi:hypothetical protein